MPRVARISQPIAPTPEYPLLPKSWQFVRFGDVVNNVNQTERNPLANGLERFVGLEHLDPRDLRIRTWGNVANGTTFNRVFRAGQVLFGKRRAYQRKAALPDFDGICSGDIYVFAANKKYLVPELLPYLVQSEGFAKQAENTSEGSLSPRTKWKYLAEYEFAIPDDMSEQRRIAELLSATEETIESWRIVRENITEMQIAFAREQLCSSKWPRKPLESLIHRLLPGCSVVGANEPAPAGKYGVLKVSAVGQTGFVPEENKVILDQAEFYLDYIVRKGDLLITRCNTRELVGRVCITDADYPNLMLCDKTIRIDVKEDLLSKSFLLEILKTQEVRRQIEGKAKGTGGSMKNISQNDIRSLLVPVPPIKVQVRLDSMIRELKSCSTIVGKYEGKARRLYVQLLKGLLTPPTGVM